MGGVVDEKNILPNDGNIDLDFQTSLQALEVGSSFIQKGFIFSHVNI